MQFKTPGSAVAVVVKREDKKETHREFLAQYLAGARAAGVCNRDTPIMLVARSALSPIAQALVAVADDLAASGLVVHALFACDERDGAGDSWTIASSRLTFARSVRIARNPRLLDAHEQLVLGGSTCWFGDSMRRDPSKRDAYERFVTDCAETARFATRSFEHLWKAGEPAGAVAAGSHETCLRRPAADISGAVAVDATDGPIGATRH